VAEKKENKALYNQSKFAMWV